MGTPHKELGLHKVRKLRLLYGWYVDWLVWVVFKCIILLIYPSSGTD